MLAWACDLIVASGTRNSATRVTMGVCGVEWFVHPWELGPRKAKELLFTADLERGGSAPARHGQSRRAAAELPSFVMALAQRSPPNRPSR